jgi:amino acid permease
MSKFKILRIDHFDPAAVGKKSRRIFIIYSIVPTVAMILLNIYSHIEKISSIILYIILPIVVVIYIFLIWKLRRTTKHIKTIGDIEFTTSGIKKRIGDTFLEYNYQMIKEIEVQKHLPATSMRESKSGYFSYILKIIFLDAGSESIVISDRSIDSKQKLSIIDTMKALKRMSPCVIKLP